MQESSLNKTLHTNQLKHEIFAKLQIPPDTPFFVRLDGWKFRAVCEKIGAEKPFDKRLAKCLIASGKTLFKSNFNPALIYAASDELNVLFLNTVPFKRRLEKINSVLAGVVSSVFSLNLQKLFNKRAPVAFDSRVIFSSPEKIVEYLTWRQRNAWRNHNNAYAYWLLRKKGYKTSEVAKKLKGLKSKELHEKLFDFGINLARTPAWQRRGILIHREPYQKKTGKQPATRWRIKENWNLPLLSSKEGKNMIQQILQANQLRK
ncbi:MAG: tRNA(His) guanylyltransferase Thg1 family protein [Thermoproteota archaeon]|nr:tRNA(His) guanylyltransferase Thg1 family protein [Thermoproteota archaeon]